MHRLPERGPFLLIKVFDTQILLHWTYLFVGISIGIICAMLSPKQALLAFISSSIACAFVIFIHELGHAIAAMSQSKKVHAIVLAGTGGWCFSDEPDTPFGKITLYSAGLVAQALLLVLTVIIIQAYGAPKNLPMTCITVVFTIGNMLIAIPNCIPKNSNDAEKILGVIREIRSDK